MGGQQNADDTRTFSMSSTDLIDSEALGLLLGLGDPGKPGSAQRAINVRIMRGHPMPPSIQLPGLRGRRWRKGAIETWLMGYERTTGKGRKPGRPRKVEHFTTSSAAASNGPTTP